jgi:hypothetical protein
MQKFIDCTINIYNFLTTKINNIDDCGFELYVINDRIAHYSKLKIKLQRVKGKVVLPENLYFIKCNLNKDSINNLKTLGDNHTVLDVSNIDMFNIKHWNKIAHKLIIENNIDKDRIKFSTELYEHIEADLIHRYKESRENIRNLIIFLEYHANTLNVKNDILNEISSAWYREEFLYQDNDKCKEDLVNTCIDIYNELSLIKQHRG